MEKTDRPSNASRSVNYTQLEELPTTFCFGYARTSVNGNSNQAVLAVKHKNKLKTWPTFR